MRIGITTHNYPPHLGGLEVIVRELAVGFSRSHEVIVVTTAWAGETGVTTEGGVVIHRLPAWHGSEEWGVPYATPYGSGVRGAMSALRSCDVLHAHGSLYATTILAYLARRSSTPVFITEHVGFVTYQSPALNLVQRAAWTAIGNPAVRKSAKVIAYNSRVRDWLASRFGNDAVAFIPNGVDTVMFAPGGALARRQARERLGLPLNGVLGLFVGRAAQKKNLDAVLGFSRQEYRLVVCGARRDLGGDVLNLGVVPYAHMPDVFAAGDFLIHAATGEGFPVTVQEAMASGLPVALLWDPGYEGAVEQRAVTSAGSLAELATVAEELARSVAKREELGQQSRDFAVRRWNWSQTIEQHLDLFQKARVAS